MIIRSGCQSWNGNPETNLFGYAIEGGRSGERNAIRANATHVAYVRKAASHYYVVTVLRVYVRDVCTAVCRAAYSRTYANRRPPLMETREWSSDLNYHRQETRATSKLRVSFRAQDPRAKVCAREFAPRKSSSVNHQPTSLCRLTIFQLTINSLGAQSVIFIPAQPFERQSSIFGALTSISINPF